MVYFAKKYLALPRTMNVTVVNIKESGIKGLSVTAVELKLLDQKLEEREWDILNWLPPVLISGFLKGFPVG